MKQLQVTLTAVPVTRRRQLAKLPGVLRRHYRAARLAHGRLAPLYLCWRFAGFRLEIA